MCVILSGNLDSYISIQVSGNDLGGIKKWMEIRIGGWRKEKGERKIQGEREQETVCV